MSLPSPALTVSDAVKLPFIWIASLPPSPLIVSELIGANAVTLSNVGPLMLMIPPLADAEMVSLLAPTGALNTRLSAFVLSKIGSKPV